MALPSTCCVCWEDMEVTEQSWSEWIGFSKKPEPQFVQLPCRQAHVICGKCLLSLPSLTTCPQHCQDAAFDRRQALKLMGLADPSRPTPSELMAACSRPYTAGNELQARVEDPRSFPSRLAHGLNIIARCDNTTCGLHNKDQFFALGAGEHDLLVDAEAYNCRGCGGPGDATKLLFRNCPIQMTVCERFQGGRKNLYAVKDSAFDTIKSYDLCGGNFVKLQMSTAMVDSASGLSFRPIYPSSTLSEGLIVNLQCLHCQGQTCIPLGVGRHDSSSFNHRSVCGLNGCGRPMALKSLGFHQVWHASVKVQDGSKTRFVEHNEPGRKTSLDLVLPDQCRIIEIHSASA